MSDWLDELRPREPEVPPEVPPVLPEPPAAAAESAAAVSRGDAAQVVQRCEYSDETRAQRIAELEQMAQANVDQRWGPKSWRAVFTSNEDLRQYKQGRLGRGARQRSCNAVFGPHMRCYAIDVRFPGDTQDGFVRSMDEPCCRKGARVLALGQSLTAANLCACRHVCSVSLG